MLKLTKIIVDKVTSHSISFIWEIDPRIRPTAFTLNIKKHTDTINDLGNIQISGSAIGYEIFDLLPNTLYELRLAPISSARQYSYSLPTIVQTHRHPQQKIFVHSERILAKETNESSQVILARKTKNWKEWANSGYKTCQPPELKELRMKRSLIYAQSLELYDEIYSQSDDYFQGPFYKTNH